MALAGRHTAVRGQNARIAVSARLHHFDDFSPVPFFCECDDPGCREFLSLSLREYDRAVGERVYVVATGHPFADGEPVASFDDHETFRLSTRATRHG